jgi:glycosyltransferase involved in cell wall biosynthesis
MNLVSIIVPCFNEENTITQLLNGLYQQTYPHKFVETIISDGFSTDNTRKMISGFQTLHPDYSIIVIDNPMKTIPAGLNAAIQAAHGEYIVRLDAHSVPATDYVERCVNALEKDLGDNVGGIWNIQPGNNSWVARSIAKAASSRLGVGDAGYRLNSKSGEVDTVPFGSFKRSRLIQLGGFDETLLTNEDYELNTRIRQSGGKVWLDDSIRSTYFARPSFTALASQYRRYGFWKAQMLKKYPATIRWRQALPPLFVLVLLVNLVMSVIQPIFIFLFLTIVCIYLLVLVIFAWLMAIKDHEPAFIIGIPCAITVMHIFWGSGFLFGLMSNPKKTGKSDKLVG